MSERLTPGKSVMVSISPRPRGIYSAAVMIAPSHPALKGLFAQRLNGPTHLLYVLTKDSKDTMHARHVVRSQQ